MAKKTDTLAQRVAHARMLRRWQGFAQDAEGMSLAQLRILQSRAQELRQPLDRIAKAADLRLTRPRPGTQAIANKPAGTDWAWRPQAWCEPLTPHACSGMANKDRIGTEIAIFHDCPLRELTLRQIRNRLDDDLSPFALRLEALGFEGSFLSLALDLPTGATRGIRADHVYQLNALASCDREMEIFARLNIKNGPNTAQMVNELKIGQGSKAAETGVEFDLAYAAFNAQRVEQVWVDLIFEGVSMNQVLLRDLTLTRRLRAEM